MNVTVGSNRFPLTLQGLGRPPLPREHGAWVMLYTPLVIGLAGLIPVAPVPALLLAIATSAAFLAQNAVSVLLKPRAPQTTFSWLVLFTSLLAVSGLGLVVGYGCWPLLWLTLPAAALFMLHLKLLKGPASARLDRTLWGELLATGTLTLTAPAAYSVARGTLDVTALALWVACLLAFASGVCHVNMRLEAVKLRQAFTWPLRWKLGKPLVAFHFALLGGIGWAAWALPHGWMVAAAFAPLLARAAWEFVQLKQGVPSFKQIGIRESVLTTWFAGWAIVMLHSLL